MMTIEITGMTCQHCVRAATEALQAVPGVTRVEVDLASGLARVDGDADLTALAAAVRTAGYEAKPA
jgi:copper chaperone CopZ